MKIPFGPFEPDKSIFSGNTSANVVNAVPVANGWAPTPGLVAVSDALPGECLGACFVITSAGIYKTVAATATGIYELDATTLGWTDITGTSGPYNADERWTFTRYGDQLMIHQINDPIQVYDINLGGVVTDLGGSPPKARYSWVAGDFFVIGNIEGTAGERTVRWAGLNDAETWTLGSKGADYQELPEGGEVYGGFGDRGGFYVIQRQGMQYFPFALETRFTFGRTVINPTQGAVSPLSIVNIGNGRFFYLSDDGFFAGADRSPIGAERVDRWFLNQVDAPYLKQVQGAADPFRKVVWWSYQAPNGSRYMIGYNWQLDRWCQSDLVVGGLIPLVTLGTTWDALDDTYASISEVTLPFDSRSFFGDKPTLATFDSDNRLAFFSGENRQAVFETSYIQFDGMARAFVNGARVTTDAPTFSLQVSTLDYHGAVASTRPSSSPNRAGLVPLRADGRLHKFAVTVAEGTEWSIMTDIEPNAQPSGQQ